MGILLRYFVGTTYLHGAIQDRCSTRCECLTEGKGTAGEELVRHNRTKGAPTPPRPCKANVPIWNGFEMPNVVAYAY